MLSVTTLEHFVRDGGWLTWVVLIPLSVVTFALAIHYLINIRRSSQVPRGLSESLVRAARDGQLRGMIEITREHPAMLAEAAHAGMLQLRAGRESARAAIEEVVEERATRLFRRIEYLNVIGNVSPMIGLIGTVMGMIQAFSRIAEAGGGMPEPAKIAGDIAMALVTTFWGILIAIPALTAHAVFRNRIDAFGAECVKVCDELIALLTQHAVRTRRAGDEKEAAAPSAEPAEPQAGR